MGEAVENPSKLIRKKKVREEKQERVIGIGLFLSKN